ncbi:MAG: 50S ribosomal protein L25 [Phycisphaerae bacterium]
MQIVNLDGKTRTPGGRHANERVRRSGYVPGVIYGHGEAPEAVAVSKRDLVNALEENQHVVKLALGGKETQYLIKDVQYDHLQREPLHVDLMRVDPNERVRVKVPLELKGTPAGAKEGGVVLHVLADIEVECRLIEIPEAIRANITEMKLGQSLHVREIELPAGVTAVTPGEDIVAVVRLPKGPETPVAEIAAGDEAAKEPEVIGRIAKDREGEGEGEAKE